MRSSIPSSSAEQESSGSGPSAPQTAEPAGRLSRTALCAYGTGLVSHQFGHVGLATLAMPIFNVELGVAPAVVGGILMAARLLDAFSDPLMGFLSDNTRTRWGRRRPYLALGAVLCAILYPLLWMAGSDWSTTMKAWYFGIFTMVFFQAHTVFSVPYLSLAFELTNDYAERTRLQAWRAMFNTAALLVIGWFFYFCQLPVWGSATRGAAVLGWIVGAAILVFGLVPAVLLREVNYGFVQHQKKQSFWRSARQVFRNKPFLILTGIIIALNVGVQTAGSLGFYLNVYFLYGGDKLSAGKLIGISQIVAAAVGFASAPLIAGYARRRDKTVALRDCMILSLLGALSSWFLFIPALPYLSLIPLLLLGLGGNAFWILVNSMKADICDWDELSSGERREGLYGAMGNWLQKSAISLTYLLAGILLQLTGFDAALGGGQSAASLNGMRLSYALLPAVFLIPCLFLLRRYPINQKVAEEMQGILQSRRQQQMPSPASPERP